MDTASVLLAVATRRDPERLSKPPAIPKIDLREALPVSCTPASLAVGPSLDLGARWKNDGARLDFGLLLASVDADSDWEAALDKGASTSLLSLCPVLISLPSDATLVRRNELDLGLALVTELSGSMTPVDSADTSGSVDEMISSIGSATAHCIETSLVEERREVELLSTFKLGFRTASATASAISCVRGLSGDLGVGNLSL